jgi:hypothetical protein
VLQKTGALKTTVAANHKLLALTCLWSASCYLLFGNGARGTLFITLALLLKIITHGQTAERARAVYAKGVGHKSFSQYWGDT